MERDFLLQLRSWKAQLFKSSACKGEAASRGKELLFEATHTELGSIHPFFLHTRNLWSLQWLKGITILEPYEGLIIGGDI